MNEKNTKEKILNTAKEEFVAKGFAGTSMGKVAKLAQVNHSLIYHHFGNKEKLWIAVKDHIVTNANKKNIIIPNTALSFRDFLSQLIINSVNFYRKNSDIAKIIYWQKIEDKKNENIGVSESKASSKWVEAFDAYRGKEINPKHSTQFILTMVASIASSLALDPNIYLKTKEEEEYYIQFCVEVLIKGLS